ncbi:MAG: hypothetical protein ABIH17_08485, partial [Pseudomonadota bacterium]
RSMPALKSDLSREELDAVQALEDRADECWRALDLGPPAFEGHRPREGRFAGRRAEPQPQRPHVAEECKRVLRGCLQTGALSFSYGDPWDLWRAMLPEYRERVSAIARRADTLSRAIRNAS